jgi:hypothetical protein
MAVLLALAMTGQASADLIPWQYSWTAPAEVSATSGGVGKITLTSEATLSAVGNSDIVATNLLTVSDADSGNPAVFTNAGYSLSMFLLDTTSGNSTTLTFSGEFSGTLTSNSALISNAFLAPTTQTVTLGANVYTVTIGPYLSAGPPTSENAGSIGASVSVERAQGVPEPSTMLLAALGGVGLVVWRRSRRRPS